MSVHKAIGPRADREAKLLIVAADRNTRAMLELAFSRNGRDFQVFTAPNGRSAMLQLAIVRPDLVLLDVTSPHGDGWETLLRIRELSTVPVIALSARKDPRTTIRSLEEGADYCLTDPLSMRELRARVSSLLHRDRSADRRDSCANQPEVDTHAGGVGHVLLAAS
jgi:DNA-binding response OmpR family regulator